VTDNPRIPGSGFWTASISPILSSVKMAEAVEQQAIFNGLTAFEIEAFRC
jgi:hypothetical protein